MKVSGPLRTRGCFHWALTRPIPSSLLLNPPTGLLEGSASTPCLTLSYQVNLSRTHRGSPQLDANELRHYEMNKNFLFRLSLSICLGRSVESRDVPQWEFDYKINILKRIFED